MKVLRLFRFWLSITALTISLFSLKTGDSVLLSIKNTEGFTLLLGNPLIWLVEPFLRMLGIETAKEIINIYRITNVILWYFIGLFLDWTMGLKEKENWIVVIRYIFILLIVLLGIDFLIILQSIRTQ
jgi:hypothetical protein